MYAVIVKEEIEIPTVINTNDKDYPTYLMAGWEVVTTGSKNECYQVEAEMLNEFKID